MSSYSAKNLRATLILPTANFPGTSSNTLTLVGYRMSATIKVGSGYPNQLNLTIFGMRQADMNALTILWSGSGVTSQNAKAFVQLEASPDGEAWTQVFDGVFLEAAPDYSDVPRACLRLQAMTGLGMQIEIAPATSYRGPTAIATIAQFLAGKMGFAFENNGVTGNLANPYYPGTYMDQFRELAEHVPFDFYFDGNNTLAICPRNQPRLNKPTPVFSPSSGLIGFPRVQRFGVHVDVLFSPALAMGALLTVADSAVPGANGTWFASTATHNLESMMPGGAWFSSIDCVRVPAAALP